MESLTFWKWEDAAWKEQIPEGVHYSLMCKWIADAYAYEHHFPEGIFLVLKPGYDLPPKTESTKARELLKGRIEPMSDRKTFLARTHGLPEAEIQRATQTEIRNTYQGPLNTEELELALRPRGDGGQFVDFWKIGGVYYLDDPTFADGIVAFTDLRYNSDIGLHSDWDKEPLAAVVPDGQDYDLQMLKVGELAKAGVTRYPEQVEYNYWAGKHDLRLFLNHPKPTEIEGIRKGTAEFGLYVEGPVIFLLYQFGTKTSGLPWSDAPYNWHLVKEAAPDLATMPPEMRSELMREFLFVTLIAADSGIVQGLRTVTFSPQFSEGVNAAIREQAKGTWIGRRAYDAYLNTIYRKFPTTESMLKQAQLRCIGGEDTP